MLQSKQIHGQYLLGRGRRWQPCDIRNAVYAFGEHVNERIDGRPVGQVSAIELFDMIKTFCHVHAKHLRAHGGTNPRGFEPDARGGSRDDNRFAT